MDQQDVFEIALAVFDKEYTDAQYALEDPPKPIRYCRRFYSMAVAKVLREFDWSFLIRELSVDTSVDEPGNGYDHGYYLPFDLFKFVRAHTSYPYQVERDKIYLDSTDEQLKFYGILNDVDLEEVPADFVELIAYALAFVLSPLLTPAGQMDSVILQKYTWTLNGLISTECQNNSRPKEFELGEDFYA